MAAIRMLFSWLTEKGVLAMNPAREVKTERFSRTEGKTPAFVEGEVQKLLGVIETTTHTGLRDRALLKATGLGSEPGSLLFPAAVRKTGKLSRRPLARTDAADMLKRRLKQAGLPAHYSPHSFRATGITNFLENDGTLEAAQRIAATPTAGPRNCMTAAVKRCSWRIWSEFDTNFELHREVQSAPRPSIYQLQP